MDFLVIAYVLIAVVVIGYLYSIHQRSQAVKRERELIETKND